MWFIVDVAIHCCCDLCCCPRGEEAEALVVSAMDLLFCGVVVEGMVLGTDCETVT